MDRGTALELMNRYGRDSIPFLFYTDWKGQRTHIQRLDENHNLLYQFPSASNIESSIASVNEDFYWEAIPVQKTYYQEAFSTVQDAILRGDSYLVNLTFPSKIITDLSLKAIFYSARAPYKIYVPDQFTFFSPEPFIKIKDHLIHTFPMKGTIIAHIPNAYSKLLVNKKELAEHSTIVDLMRNDLSMMASDVTVEKFRYIDLVSAFPQDLLQMSSHISGRLNEDWPSQLGAIIYRILPAGSISGAPKKRTVEIIEEAEVDDRRWYTGVCGIFDGRSLDSAVMIRYVEEEDGRMIYRSGGGVTALSDMDQEYQELVDKIYVPIYRNDSGQQWKDFKSISSQ